MASWPQVISTTDGVLSVLPPIARALSTSHRETADKVWKGTGGTAADGSRVIIDNSLPSCVHNRGSI